MTPFQLITTLLSIIGAIISFYFAYVTRKENQQNKKADLIITSIHSTGQINRTSSPFEVEISNRGVYSANNITGIIYLISKGNYVDKYNIFCANEVSFSRTFITEFEAPKDVYEPIFFCTEINYEDTRTKEKISKKSYYSFKMPSDLFDIDNIKDLDFVKELISDK